jgi:two-component system response regulator AtoC
MRKSIQDVSPPAMSLLLNYDWPGNVRELENVIERAVLLADDTILMSEHLPAELSLVSKNADRDFCLQGLSLKKTHQAIEKRLIIRALRETRGNRTHAARLLEISHPSLLSKIKHYEIEGACGKI